MQIKQNRTSKKAYYLKKNVIGLKKIIKNGLKKYFKIIIIWKTIII